MRPPGSVDPSEVLKIGADSSEGPLNCPHHGTTHATETQIHIANVVVAGEVRTGVLYVYPTNVLKVVLRLACLL